MKITFMNPVAEKMSGWTQEAALGVPLLSGLHITFGDNGPLMENIYSADTSRSRSNKMWCCTVGAAAVTTCITVLRR
ncbi:hypothetical protein ACLK11_11885 [Escherichia coli]